MLRIKASLLRERQSADDTAGERKRRPIELFDGVFHEQPERRITIPRAQEEGLLKGVVSYTQLYSYLEGFPEGFGLEKYFPEGRFPSESRTVSGSSRQVVATILPSHLAKLARAKRELLEGAESKSHEKTGNEICDHYKIGDVADRFAVHAFLASTFPFKPTLRATAGARGWSYPAIYDLREVKRRFDRRDKLLAAANDFLKTSTLLKRWHRGNLPETPYVPTVLHRRILTELEGKALTADELQRALRIHRYQLYHGALSPSTELRRRGFVKNDRNVGGYYRPDAPPHAIRCILPK